MASLQRQIEAFVDRYAPVSRDGRNRFVDQLRAAMEAYALEALQHGALPNKGEPHIERVRR